MKASEIILDMFMNNNGKLTILTLLGKEHEFTLTDDKCCIESETALPNQKLHLTCFDLVVELLIRNGGKAHKGNGRGRENKVGQGKCTIDTVCGYIAVNYYGHSIGDSTFDPVFVISAILDQVNICENTRGWINFKKNTTTN